MKISSKQTVILFTLLAAAAFFFPCSHSSAAQYPHGAVIKAGFFPFNGYHMTDSDGHRSGYGYEILQRLRMYTGWEYEYIGDSKGEPSTWADMLKMLEDGRIDILSSITKTPERLKKFDFTEMPIGVKSTKLTVKAGNTRFSVENYGNWNGMRVGMLPNNSQNQAFASFAKLRGFSFVSVFFEDEEKLKKALFDGKIDASVISSLSRTDNEWVIAQLDPKPFYIAVKKGRPQLLAELNNALNTLYSTSPNFSTVLNKKYYMQSSERVFFTAEERRFIHNCAEKNVVFSVLMGTERRPYSYTGKDGHTHGTCPDIAREIFSRTGLSFKYIVPETRERYWELIRAGKPDIVADFPYFLNNAEECHYLLCEPYIFASISAISLKSKSGVKPKTAAIQTNWLGSVSSFKSLWEGLKVVPCHNINDCHKALKRGTADIAILLTDSALWLANSDYTNRLVCRKEPIAKVGMTVAVHDRENRLLLSILNKAGMSVSEEFIEDTARRNIALAETNRPTLEFLYEHPLVVSLLVICFFIIVFLLIMARFAKIRNRREEELNKKLSAAIVDVKRANSAQSDFFSRMSHDIRTPLNGILGMTALAMNEKNNPQTEEYLGKIDKSGHLLLELVNDILDISKVESGQMELHPEPHTNSELWQYIRDVIEPLCVEKDIELTLEPVQKKFTVMLDKLRFNRIFFNLLSNSVKFTPRGGHIFLGARIVSEKGGVVTVDFTVKDDGCGMSKEFLKRLFLPFAQEYSAGNANRHGSGLGLAITKQLTEMMGGTIKVSSNQGLALLLQCACR